MFLLMSGLSAYLRIFLVLALALAVILMVFVYRLDPLDKEPVNLLWSLILSGVCAGLIAGVENIMYALNYGTGVFLTRALMAIPAHMGFAVLFGIFYGEAKYLSAQGRRGWPAACVVVGYAPSVFLHGPYDSAAKHDKRFAY